MARTVDLCGRCLIPIQEHYEIKVLAKGANTKVYCEQCQRMRYGGRYEIGKKKR